MKSSRRSNGRRISPPALLALTLSLSVATLAFYTADYQTWRWWVGFISAMATCLLVADYKWNHRNAMFLWMLGTVVYLCVIWLVVRPEVTRVWLLHAGISYVAFYVSFWCWAFSDSYWEDYTDHRYAVEI